MVYVQIRMRDREIGRSRRHRLLDQVLSYVLETVAESFATLRDSVQHFAAREGLPESNVQCRYDLRSVYRGFRPVAQHFTLTVANLAMRF